MKVSAARKAESLERLRQLVEPGDTLYTVLRHRSASGMTRAIDVYLILDGDGRKSRHPVTILWLSRSIADVLGYSWSENHDALSVQGAGMDMGYSIIHNLSYALFPDGFYCTGDACPHNDHVNDYQSPRGGKGSGKAYKHRGGTGYALRHDWIG